MSMTWLTPRVRMLGTYLGIRLFSAENMGPLEKSNATRLNLQHEVTTNMSPLTSMRPSPLWSNQHPSGCSSHFAKLSFKTWHMDITSAFLNGVLNKTVYMHQPKGFEVLGKEAWVWKLKKALYSLKQGGHEWYHCINKFLMKTLGLT